MEIPDLNFYPLIHPLHCYHSSNFLMSSVKEEEFKIALVIATALLKQVREERKEKKEGKIQCFYTCDYDNNQTIFERLTTQNLLGLWAYDEEEAGVVFRVLRFVVDENPYALEMEDEKLIFTDEVTTSPNVLYATDRPAENGVALSKLLGVSHPVVMMGLEEIERLVQKLSANFVE